MKNNYPLNKKCFSDAIRVLLLSLMAALAACHNGAGRKVVSTPADRAPEHAVGKTPGSNHADEEIWDSNGTRYLMVRKDFSSGFHSIVSEIKRVPDGARFVIKKPRDAEKDLPAFVKEIGERREAMLRLLAKTGGDIWIIPDALWNRQKDAIIKEYVAGKSLNEFFDDPAFWQIPPVPGGPRNKLEDLFERLINENAYVADLSTENLIYSGDKWVIIDTSDVEENVTPLTRLKKKYSDDLSLRWTRTLQIFKGTPLPKGYQDKMTELISSLLNLSGKP